ncbi:MAG: hypothetical protein ACRCXZ_03740 [Patescibacteria group bacterium]
MKIKTRIIGPNLIDKIHNQQVLEYLNVEYDVNSDYFDNELYLLTLEKAKTDLELARMLETFPRSQPTLVDLKNLIVEDIGTYEGEDIVANFVFNKSYHSPDWSRLELTVRRDDKYGGLKLYIEDFFPGYLMSGQVGIGKPLFKEVIKIGKSFDCKSVYCIPVKHSIGFWVKMGLVNLIPTDPYDPAPTDFYRSKNI